MLAKSVRGNRKGEGEIRLDEQKKEVKTKAETETKLWTKKAIQSPPRLSSDHAVFALTVTMSALMVGLGIGVVLVVGMGLAWRCSCASAEKR